MQEIWKTVIIDGEIYENYEVSNLGKIRSLNYRHTGVVKELKLRVSHGYLQVHLCKNGKVKYYRVHRLVAFAFIENDNPTEKIEVNHINEIKTDNRVENLEWVTPKQNSNHGTRTERVAKAQRGRKSKRSKKVICVETGIVYGSTREVERKLGLAHNNICNCCNGNLKTVGGYHWMYYEDYLKLNENSDSNVA